MSLPAARAAAPVVQSVAVDPTSSPPWFWRRLQPPADAGKAPHDDALEGLRGLCAYAVVYTHAFISRALLDPLYVPPHQFWWFDLGSTAVLVFFVLSGYVIGLTTRGPASGPNVRRYLSRRAWRLVPINTVAVLLAFALWRHQDWRGIVCNLLFLENHEPYPLIGTLPVLPNNPALWSLNFEVVFYLLFLAAWRWAPRLGTVLLLAFAAIAWQTMHTGSGLVIGAYAAGALSWFGGLALAWFTRPAPPDQTRTPWVAALAGVFALWSIGPLRSLAQLWDIQPMLWPMATSPHRLDFIPGVLWLVLAVTGRAPRAQRILSVICLSLATGTWLFRLALGIGALRELDWVALPFLVTAWALRNRPVPLAPLRRLAPLGTISFAVYVIGLPIQMKIVQIAPEFAGTALTFTVRVIAQFTIVTVFAWWLERRFAPWLKRRFARPAAVTAV